MKHHIYAKHFFYDEVVPRSWLYATAKFFLNWLIDTVWFLIEEISVSAQKERAHKAEKGIRIHANWHCG